MAKKLRRSFEYQVTLTGVARMEFTVTLNQAADNAEEAARAARQKFRKKILDVLDPKVSAKSPVVKSTKVDEVTLYKG